MLSSKFNLRIVIMALMLILNGCATTSTLYQPAHERKPLVMSGTRLNIASLRNEPDLKEKYGVSPPDFPLLDLPLSAFFDFIALDYSVPVALFY